MSFGMRMIGSIELYPDKGNISDSASITNPLLSEGLSSLRVY